MRLIVPCYAYPGTQPAPWDALAAAGRSISHVIVNPGNGPGAIRDSHWVEVVRRLEALGVPMLGYLHDDYADRSLGDLLQEAATWRRWYGISSYFLDCVSSSDARRAVAVADVLGASARGSTLVANPGMATEPEVARHFDVVVEHEGQPPSARPHPRGHAGVPARPGGQAQPSRSWIVHGASEHAARQTLRAAQAAGVSELWVTDLRGDNPYRGLPSYWPWLAEAVAADG